jgi:putative transposase
LEVDYQQRVHSSTGVAPLTRWRDHIGNFLRTVGEKELLELFLWQVNRTVNKVGLVSVQGLEFEVESMLHNKKVEVRYNPFDLAAVHIYYQGRFFQKALPAKISRWNLAAKAKSAPPSPATPTGIKPLAQLAEQHHTQKQQHAQQLVGAKAQTEPQLLTLPELIHAIASALGKKADAFHPREIEAMQTFFATYQPLRAETVGIAMAKAVLAHGTTPQHIDVYLEAIKTVHLKWQNQENKS